jgi:hypothetical protein
MSIRDSLILLGVIAMTYGCYAAWAPLGFIIGGACLAAFGVLWEMDRQRRAEREQRNRRDGI